MARIAVTSEVAGTVWKVDTEPGRQVAEGDTLLIVEAMKMEIPVLATAAGTVAEVLVRERDTVAEGQEVALLDT